MIIMDDERIAAAKALRERAKRPLGKSMQLMFSETLGLHRECVGRERQTEATETWANIVNYLADLVDRPTCRNVADPADGSLFECSNCGEMWELTCGSPEDNNLFFCPNCGCQVVNAS